MTRRSRAVIGGILLALLLAGALAVIRRGFYGWAVFAAAPVVAGALLSWIMAPRNGTEAAALGSFAGLAGLSLFVLLGWEGFNCILMAFPLVMPMGALGGWLAHKATGGRAEQPGVAMLLLLPVAALSWDMSARPDVFEVHSSVEIAVPPEKVWRHVITFSDLAEPREWYFRTGIAYPKRARIVGTGTGATRYCEFSTGAFVEPIEVWDEPRLLRFRVTASPPPMREWSPFGEVHPRHLDGYMISKRGQFRLTRLDNGHTILEGATWYQHGLWPAQYWRWWSEAIIHRIHVRVLSHIKTLAEAQDVSWPASAVRQTGTP